MLQRKHIKAPTRHDPGKGFPTEQLIYAAPWEMEMLRQLTDGTISRGPKGIPSFVAPPSGGVTKTNYNSGPGTVSSNGPTAGQGSNYSTTSGYKTPTTSGVTGNKSSSTTASSKGPGGSQAAAKASSAAKAPSSTAGAQKSSGPTGGPMSAGQPSANRGPSQSVSPNMGGQKASTGPTGGLGSNASPGAAYSTPSAPQAPSRPSEGGKRPSGPASPMAGQGTSYKTPAAAMAGNRYQSLQNQADVAGRGLQGISNTPDPSRGMTTPSGPPSNPSRGVTVPTRDPTLGNPSRGITQPTMPAAYPGRGVTVPSRDPAAGNPSRGITTPTVPEAYPGRGITVPSAPPRAGNPSRGKTVPTAAPMANPGRGITVPTAPPQAPSGNRVNVAGNEIPAELADALRTSPTYAGVQAWQLNSLADTYAQRGLVGDAAKLKEMARTIYGEGGRETPAQRAAIANVMQNRLALNPGWGRMMAAFDANGYDVDRVGAPNSGYKSAKLGTDALGRGIAALENANSPYSEFSTTAPESVKNATHYYADYIKAPSWAKNNPTWNDSKTQYGTHIFGNADISGLNVANAKRAITGDSGVQAAHLNSISYTPPQASSRVPTALGNIAAGAGKMLAAPGVGISRALGSIPTAEDVKGFTGSLPSQKQIGIANMADKWLGTNVVGDAIGGAVRGGLNALGKGVNNMMGNVVGGVVATPDVIANLGSTPPPSYNEGQGRMPTSQEVASANKSSSTTKTSRTSRDKASNEYSKDAKARKYISQALAGNRAVIRQQAPEPVVAETSGYNQLTDAEREAVLRQLLGEAWQ